MRGTIDMAREAGATVEVGMAPVFNTHAELKRFEALVRADERNRTWTQEHWTEYERSIAAQEREVCAKVCEKAIASIWEYSPEDVKQTGTNVCNNLAAAIRARGAKHD
jgi:DNA-directed RNA polymerase subunit E'/Rpb7